MKTATLPAATRYLPSIGPSGHGAECLPNTPVDRRVVERPLEGSIPGDLRYPAPGGALRLLHGGGVLRRELDAWLDHLPAWLRPGPRSPEAMAEAALRMLWREAREARRRRRPVAPVILGEAGRDPYLRGEALPLLLERLAGPAGEDLPGLRLTLVSRAPRLLWDIPRLARLDERHAVIVALPVLPSRPLALSDAGLLERSRYLAAAGLAVRWLLDPRAVARTGSPPAVQTALARALDAASELGVEDVELLEVTGPAPGIEGVERALGRLRLQKGFPRGWVGRG